MDWHCKSCGKGVGWLADGLCIFCCYPSSGGSLEGAKAGGDEAAGVPSCIHCLGAGKVIDSRGDKWPCLRCRDKQAEGE